MQSPAKLPQNAPLTFASAVGRFSPWLLAAALALITLGTWLTTQYIESRYRQQLENTLITVLESANEALTIWTQDHLLEVSAKTESPALLQATEPLLETAADRKQLLKNPGQAMLSDLFQTMLARGRIGASGETYAFDQTGLLLSPSHFEQELAERGLAASATSKGWGSDMTGYLDYRGVPLVGAWLWNDQLGIGLVTKQDLAEAYDLLELIQAFILACGFAAGMILTLLYLATHAGRGKVERAEQRLAAILDTATDGSRFPPHLSINPLGLEGRQYFAGVLQDLSAINDATREQCRFMKTLDQILDCVFIFDPDSLRFNYVNQGAIEQVGYSREEMLEMTPLDIKPDIDEPQFRTMIAPLVAGQQSQLNFETDHQHKDGRRIPVEISMQFVEADGETARLVAIVRNISQRKAAEQELQDERGFYQQTLDSLSANIAVFDKTGTLIYVNRPWVEYARKNGLSREASGVGSNYLAVSGQKIMPGGEETLDDRFRALLSGQALPFSLEYERHSATEQHWFQMRAERFHHRGEPVVVMSHLDITQRVRAEQQARKERDAALKANEILMLTEQALNHTGIGEFWVRAEDGMIERVNDHGCATLGYSREALLAMRIPDIDPNFSKNEWGQRAALIKEAGQARFETVHITGDGRHIPVEVTALYQPENSLSGDGVFITFVQDISERKRNEQALERAAEELRMTSLVAEKTDNAVILTNLSAQIIWVNRGFTRITGYPPEEVIGRKPGHFLQGPETDPDTVRLIGEKLARKERVKTNILNYNKNGQPYWINLEITPVLDENGEAFQFVALERDVTAERNAADALRKAKEEAENANRAKSTFLAVMSHEIRTPLNGVVSTIDMLSHGDLDAHHQDLVRTAKASSRTLMTIIDDILDFSKIEAGRMSLEENPFRWERIVEDLGDSLRSNAIDRGVELLTYCDPALGGAVGDPTRVTQILYNLTGNALKFSSHLDGRKGRVFVRVERRGVENGRSVVSLSVQDNGIGMDDEVKSRIFKPFVQGEESTTRRFGGTGLGLVITKRLVDLMDGDIRIESREGAGSTFSITLRLPEAPTEKTALDHALSSVLVWVIETEQAVDDIIIRYLEYAGARVTRIDRDAVVERLRAADLEAGDRLCILCTAGYEPWSEAICHRLRNTTSSVTPGYVMGTRGERKVMKLAESSRIHLNLDALKRARLINAVAVAVGLESPEAEAVDPLALPAQPPRTQAEARAKGLLVLLADDHPTNRKVIGFQLEMLGYAVDPAEDGKEALECWRKGDYPLLLTDCHMPVMDGYDLSRAIRAEETDGRHTPIIAITADAMKGTSEKCFAAGMDGYLTKPIQLHELKAALEQWIAPVLDSRAEAEEAETAPAGASDVEEDAVDANTLRSVLGIDDPETLRHFYQEFLSTSTDIINDLERVHAKGALAEVGALAHKLKSSANTIGAFKMGDCCLDLEKAGKAGDRERLLAAMPLLGHHYANVRAWIENQLASTDRS